MPRFVILTHDHPHRHWDLMWEEPPKEKLRTWRLHQPPAERTLITATALPDHRQMYLEYEGPVSGDRGKVWRWDFGEVKLLSDTGAKIELRLFGRHLNGKAVLIQSEAAEWTFQFASETKDDETRPND